MKYNPGSSLAVKKQVYRLSWKAHRMYKWSKPLTYIHYTKMIISALRFWGIKNAGLKHQNYTYIKTIKTIKAIKTTKKPHSPIKPYQPSKQTPIKPAALEGISVSFHHHLLAYFAAFCCFQYYLNHQP